MSDPFYLGFPKVDKTEETDVSLTSSFSLVFDKDDFLSKKIYSEESGTKPDEKNTSGTADQVIGFGTIQQSFFEQMLAFIEILPVSHAAVHFGRAVLVNELQRKIRNYNEGDPEEIGAWNVHVFPDQLYSSVTKEVRRTKRQIESMWVFPNIFLMGLVSQYDAYFGSLIRELAAVKPHIIMDSGRQFSAKEVFEYTDVDAFKFAVVEKEIESVLRSSHEEQFVWLEGKSGVPLRKDLAVWPDFIEICERRNLFAHTNGIVSEQYLLKCRSAEYETDSKIGDQLKAEPLYLANASKAFLEIGVKLCQVLWRTSKKSAEVDKEANSSLSDIAYELIYHEEYTLAISLLEFGLSSPMKHPDSVTKSMMIVNLANAHRLLDQKDKAEEILRKVDWGPYQLHFKICVAAILDEEAEVVSLLKEIPEKDIRPQDYFTWPIFRRARNEEYFISALEERFGREVIKLLSLEQGTTPIEGSMPTK